MPGMSPDDLKKEFESKSKDLVFNLEKIGKVVLIDLFHKYTDSFEKLIEVYTYSYELKKIS